jgi:rRNA maturation endonuclease Nob1
VSEAVVLARKKLKLEGQRKRRATQESWREIKKRREAEKEELALDSGDPKVAIPAVLAALCNQVVARNLKLKRREAMLRNLKLARNLKLKRREAKVAVAAGGGEGA